MGEVRHRKVSEDTLSKLPILGTKPKNEREEKHLREVCEFEFYNLEEPGLTHCFTYGNTRNNSIFTMYHGEKYNVPRCVARHLESKGTPIWDWRPDGSGRIKKKEIGMTPRFRMSGSFV